MSVVIFVTVGGGGSGGGACVYVRVCLVSPDISN